MSIVIKSNEVNYLIYKYLMESGLQHTAFSLFYEAGLEETVKQYKYDSKAGHLVSVLEKGLILTQIQTHVCLDAYMECKQPVHLLKPHTCNIIEKARKMKKKVEDDSAERIYDSIKRTNDVYANHVKNNQYPPLVQPPKQQTDILAIFPKIPMKTTGLTTLSQMSFSPKNDTFLVNEFEYKRLSLLKIGQSTGANNKVSYTIENFGVIPAVFGSEFMSVSIMYDTGAFTILVFQGSRIMILNPEYELFGMFEIEPSNPIVRVEANKSYPGLLAFVLQRDDVVHVISLRDDKPPVDGHIENGIVCEDKIQFVGRIENCKVFRWRYVNQYVVWDGTKLTLRSLENGRILLEFDTQGMENIDHLDLSPNREYLIASSSKNNSLKLFTFLKPEPLFLIQQEFELITAVVRLSRGANYLIIITQKNLRIWDIVMASFKWEVTFEDRVTEAAFVCEGEEIDDKGYLIALAPNALVFYDISDTKDAVVALSQTGDITTPHLNQYSETKCALVMSDRFYPLQARAIQQSFSA